MHILKHLKIHVSSLGLLILAIVVFFGFSLNFSKQSKNQLNLLEGAKLDFAGMAKINAGTDSEDSWGFVRQSVTWANANSNAIDGILRTMNDGGVFNLPDGTYTKIDEPFGNIPAKWQLKKGNFNSTVTWSGGTTGEYKNSFIIWRASDDAKAMELYFDDYGDTSGDGALLIYRPKVLDPATFTGNDTVVESYITGTPGSRTQTYSWKNGPLVSGGGTDRARVFLEEMESGGLLCVKTVVRLNSTIEAQLRSNIASCDTSPLYYSTAYGQKTTDPFQTTAKVALWETADYGNQQSICGNNISGTSFRLDYGIFNGSGFINDGLQASEVPADFRSASAIDALFAEINDAGQSAIQRLDRATIDALDTAVDFRSSDAAPTSNSF